MSDQVTENPTSSYSRTTSFSEVLENTELGNMLDNTFEGHATYENNLQQQVAVLAASVGSVGSKINFKCGTQSAYDSLSNPSADTIYFTTDAQRMFVGSVEYTRPVRSGTALPTSAVPANSLFVLKSGSSNSLCYTSDGTSWSLLAGASPEPATSTPESSASTASVGTSTKYAREDHVHDYPYQLKHASSIDGIGFDGSSDVSRFATCSTASSTAAKTVYIPNFALDTGATIRVKFSDTNAASSPTLDVNSTGAKPICNNFDNGAFTELNTGVIYELVYDGTYWRVVTSDKIRRANVATALYTTRHIDGVGFNGMADIHHFTTCSTDAATAAKTASFVNFVLNTGSRVFVKFSYTNTAASPTLNVSSTGAKSIYKNGGSGYYTRLRANKTYEMVYDGTYWRVINEDNVESTDTLVSTRYIDGQGFNGGSNIYHYGTCSTSASTAAKTVALSNFTLSSGSRIFVKFSYANTATTPTLNVNSTGAKSIYKQGSTSTRYTTFSANKVYEFVYDGSYWRVINEDPDVTVETGTFTLTNSSNSSDTITGGTYYKIGKLVHVTFPGGDYKLGAYYSGLPFAQARGTSVPYTGGVISCMGQMAGFFNVSVSQLVIHSTAVSEANMLAGLPSSLERFNFTYVTD